MKSFFLVSALCLVSFSIEAQTLFCSGGVSQDGKSQVSAVISSDVEASVVTTYVGYSDSRTTILPFTSAGFYSFSEGDCSDQTYGGHDYILTINGDTATYDYSWCDDDGWYGYQTYTLKCTEK